MKNLTALKPKTHGKNKRLRAKTWRKQRRYGKTKNLRQKRKPHGETKRLTAKAKASRQKKKTLRQNQEPHDNGKNKNVTAHVCHGHYNCARKGYWDHIQHGCVQLKACVEEARRCFAQTAALSSRL